MTTRPRALLMDLDGTLMDHAGASAHAILAVLADRDLSPTEDSVALWRALEAEHFQRYLDGELTFEEQRVARITAFLAAHGAVALSRADSLSWFEGYLARYESSWRPFDDVRPFLDAVAALPAPPLVAVVTNGHQMQQQAKLTAIGLGSMTMYASSTMGVRKPDPHLFLQVCDDLGVAPEQAWFIGDDLETDAVGSESAGLHGIWLNRAATTNRRGRPSRAASLTDIATWLQTTTAHHEPSR
ncbi:HAD family hydrolase [Arachnia propionica]|uniref:HAD family hydrolase n=1 Tax=Arachnia propionica TaxID=1750 RepID=A0A3P1WWB2_9ACTN|nr:HAD family hydrolase [Arachnia propionica]RRD50326.1 HAD family hydrolase [Arachnia propionica]